MMAWNIQYQIQNKQDLMTIVLVQQYHGKISSDKMTRVLAI